MKRFIAIVALVCLGIFQGAPAHAHNSLTSTSPARGAMLTVAPTEVLLTFDLPFIGGQSANVVTVTNESGDRVDNNDSHVEANTLRATLQDLPTGIYTVNFRIVSDDGHPVSNSFQFGVALPEPSTSPDAPVPTSTASAKPKPHKSQRSAIATPSPTQSSSPATPTPASSPIRNGSQAPTSTPTKIEVMTSQSTNMNLLWTWLIPTIVVSIGVGYLIRRRMKR